MMKKSLSSALVLAALASTATGASAQTAGQMLLKFGYNQIMPEVSSGDLSAPSFPSTKIDVKEAGAPIVTLAYMYSDHFSAEFYAGLGYKHDIVGDGAIKGVGKIGQVEQVSPTLFAQYRFLDAQSFIRPYVGLGITYAYFYNEEGSAALTALTNPGGTPTLLAVDDAFGVSPQLGATLAIDRQWFVDMSVIKTFIKTTSHLSTGQSIDTQLDPLVVNLAVGYKF